LTLPRRGSRTAQRLKTQEGLEPEVQGMYRVEEDMAEEEEMAPSDK
jgi:hypothetical protein